ncbi:MAG: GNAT family protein [Rhodomicrobium sp.]
MLIGEKVCLGPILQADAAVLFNWLNTVSLMHLNGHYMPVSQRSFDEWYGAIGKDSSRVVFSIRKQGDLALLGYIQLTDIHPVFRSAVVGVTIGDPANRGKGYGQEALRLCIAFSWNDLNLQRLSLMIAGSNELAMRAYKKVGFEQEGVFKRAIFANGVYMDSTIMGLLRSD